MLLNGFTREEYVAYERAFTAALGRNIAAARTAQGYSQRGLAQACGLSTTGIAEIETAARGIGLSALQQIADVLGITSTSLLPKL
jgi:transcriptional regulator with XRE-family HTH domain